MSKVGNETMADTSGAGLDRTRGESKAGSVVGNTKLSHAVEHLHAEHPIKYDDLGPHHGAGGGMTQHMPLGGMRPKGQV